MRLDLPDGDVVYFPAPALPETPEALLEMLTTQIHWRAETITLYGKTYPQPRLIAWHGDPDATYSYSKKTWEPQPWTPLLHRLKACVEAACEAPFNAVLLNLYRDGRDSMGFHSDDEPELGEQPVIGSLSLGAERALIFQHRSRKEIAPVKIVLASGSLLVMRGATQTHWKHGIRKTTRPCGPRINLTFRLIRPGCAAGTHSLKRSL